jgi:hypothetical protein
MKRALWTILLAAPVLAWLALAELTLTHVPRRVHTGDALIDAYAQAVADQEGMQKLGAGDSQPWLTEKQWLKLEQRFGGDARFWWLCYQHRRAPSVAFDPQRYAYLQEARRRGVANLPILLVLNDYNSVCMYSSVANNANIPKLPRRPQPHDYSQFNHARRVVLDRAGDVSSDVLLAEMRASAPRHPLPYYLQALLAGERKQFDTARALLEQGNAVAKNAARSKIVLSDLYYPLNIKSINASDMRLGAFLAETSAMGYDAFGEEFQTDTTALSYDAFCLRRLDIINELHKMCCYTALSTNFHYAPTELAFNACQVVRGQAMKYAPFASDPDKTAALEQLSDAQNALCIMQMYKGEQSQHLTPVRVQFVHAVAAITEQINRFIDALSQGYFIPATRLLALDPGDHDPRVRQGNYQDQSRNMCTDLLRFDYTTCSFGGAAIRSLKRTGP